MLSGIVKTMYLCYLLYMLGELGLMCLIAGCEFWPFVKPLSQYLQNILPGTL